MNWISWYKNGKLDPRIYSRCFWSRNRSHALSRRLFLMRQILTRALGARTRRRSKRALMTKGRKVTPVLLKIAEARVQTHGDPGNHPLFLPSTASAMNVKKPSLTYSSKNIRSLAGRIRWSGRLSPAITQNTRYLHRPLHNTIHNKTKQNSQKRGLFQ